jgi:class 3 adenylate cyclase
MEMGSPSMLGDEACKEWWATHLTRAASPGAAKSVLRMNTEIDVGRVLPAVYAPTLNRRRTGDRVTTVDLARYLAKDIGAARLVELPGANSAPWAGDTDALADEIEEFLTGIRQAPEPDRILATILFTDIVGSTRRAVELGDRNWRELLHQHDRIVRRQLARFHGREMRNNGDGFFAAFDGPGRAICCAGAIHRQLRPLGIEVRAGLHTGECHIEGNELSGIAVHIGNRVAASAKPGEVLVSSTVKDLVVGSSHFAFEDRGMHALKGLPEEWHLFAAVPADGGIG